MKSQQDKIKNYKNNFLIYFLLEKLQNESKVKCDMSIQKNKFYFLMLMLIIATRLTCQSQPVLLKTYNEQASSQPADDSKEKNTEPVQKPDDKVDVNDVDPPRWDAQSAFILESFLDSVSYQQPTYVLDKKTVTLTLNVSDNDYINAYYVKESNSSARSEEPGINDEHWIKLETPAQALKNFKIQYHLQSSSLTPPYGRIVVWVKDKNNNISVSKWVYVACQSNIFYTKNFKEQDLEPSSHVVLESLSARFDKQQKAHLVYVKDDHGNKTLVYHAEDNRVLKTAQIYSLSAIKNTEEIHQLSLWIDDNNNKQIALSTLENTRTGFLNTIRKLVLRIYFLQILADNTLRIKLAYGDSIIRSLQEFTYYSPPLFPSPGSLHSIVYFFQDSNKKINAFFSVHHLTNLTTNLPSTSEVEFFTLQDIASALPTVGSKKMIIDNIKDIDNRYTNIDMIPFLWSGGYPVILGSRSAQCNIESPTDYEVYNLAQTATAVVSQKILSLPCTSPILQAAYHQNLPHVEYRNSNNQLVIAQIGENGTYKTTTQTVSIMGKHYFGFNKNSEIIYLVPETNTEIVLSIDKDSNRMASVIAKENKLVFRNQDMP